MSIFVRPDSPPPRQPSPDILFAPLPCPHPRRVLSQPKMGLHSPVVPPGLDTPTRTVQSSRSFDGLNRQRTTPLKNGQNMWTGSCPRIQAGARGSPSSPSPPMSTRQIVQHGQSPSGALTPSPSPSLTPSLNIAQPSPSCTTPRSWLEPICSEPVSLKKPVIIRRIDLEEGRPDTPAAFLERKQILPALEKHKSMGMMCLKFFGLRGSPSQHRTAVAAF